MEKKTNQQAMSLQVTEGLTVTIRPDSNHEFLMSTKDVAFGYNISAFSIRRHKVDHKDELIEGKHFLSSVSIPHVASAGSSKGTLWTKRGIVRLGFFIKSERAKLFRDWAEDLVINQVEKHTQKKLFENAAERKLNPKEDFSRLIDLISSAAIICGSEVRLGRRLGIPSPNFSLLKKRPWLLSQERIEAIEKGCRNIISSGSNTDVNAIESLLMIEDKASRLYLFNKMKKGGLL